MSTSMASEVALDVAKKFNPLSSGRLLLYGSLACFLMLVIGIALGWWNGDRLRAGAVARDDNVELRKSVATASQLIVRQQQVMSESSALLQSYQTEFAKISEDTVNERLETQRQMAVISSALEASLAARPELERVRVGRGVLDAWNAANRGRAAGVSPVPAAVPALRSQPAAARPRQPARGKK